MRDANDKDEKIGKRESGRGQVTYYWKFERAGNGSLDLLLEFWDPLHISGTVWDRNFKFDVQIDHRGINEKMQN